MKLFAKREFVYSAWIVMGGIAWVPASSHAAGSAPSGLTSKTDAAAPEQRSYDVGLLLGSQLQHEGAVAGLSLNSVIRGLKDAAGGRVVSADERETALRFVRDARAALVEKNKSAGREFLERNARQPGVRAMPSGMQYLVLADGKPGVHPPAPTDEVTVSYRTRLVDGSEIDSSESHGRPATFRVNTVLKGWQEALKGMSIGAKWQLFVPSELAYGSNSPPTVPPGALLIYDLELLRIDPAAPMAPHAGSRPADGHPLPPAPAAVPRAPP